MLETGDQAVDGEGVAPGHFDPGKAGWFLQAGSAHQAVARQRQGANLAMPAEPG